MKEKKKRTGVIIAAVIGCAAILTAGAFLLYHFVFAPDGDAVIKRRADSGSRTASESAAASETESETEAMTEVMTEAPTEALTDASTEAPTEAPVNAVDEAPVSAATAFSSASADSVLGNQKDANGTWHNYRAENVLTADSSCWSTDGSGISATITLRLPEKQRVSGLRVINGYAGSQKQYTENSMPSTVVCTFSDGTTETVYLKRMPVSDRSSVQTLTFDSPHNTEYVKLTISDLAKGSTYNDTCVTFIEPF